MKRTALRARYVFPVDGPYVTDGLVTIDGDKIADVERATAEPLGKHGEHIDLGNVAILPGLINAHTHLEFSHLTRPIGSPGMAFPDWIAAVIDYRRQSEAMFEDDSPQDIAARHARAVRQGLLEAAATGATSLGDICRTDVAGVAEDWPGLDVTSFREYIGLRREQVDNVAAEAEQFVASADARAAADSPRAIRLGLSPHAPYTVHPQLFRRLIALAEKHDLPVAFHLAESKDEIELLRSHSGAFHTFLSSIGFWSNDCVRRGTRPMDYLKVLAECRKSLVIHGNYLDADELAFVASRATHMSVVYCARTHAYFQHDRHPLPWLLSAGANVALGTDSRASSPDLDLLAEMRAVAAAFPEISPSTVLDLGTIRGAWALGIDDVAGSITRGKRADLAIVRLPDRDARDPYELLFDSTEPVVATICGGRVVHSAHQELPNS